MYKEMYMISIKKLNCFLNLVYVYMHNENIILSRAYQSHKTLIFLLFRITRIYLKHSS